MNEKENNNIEPGPTIKILILDRTYDLITPLIHDFHY